MEITEEIVGVMRSYGWDIKCESPLEIRHTDSGDFASGYAAKVVIEHYMSSEEEE